MKNQAKLKMADCNHSHLLIIVAIFITRAIINHNNDKVSNDPNVSQNYKEVENQNDDINRQVDSAKSDIKNKKDTQSQIDKLQIKLIN